MPDPAAPKRVSQIAVPAQLRNAGWVMLLAFGLAVPLVILRLTNSNPRRGPSWLNRMPLLQNMP